MNIECSKVYYNDIAEAFQPLSIQPHSSIPRCATRGELAEVNSRVLPAGLRTGGPFAVGRPGNPRQRR